MCNQAPPTAASKRMPRQPPVVTRWHGQVRWRRGAPSCRQDAQVWDILKVIGRRVYPEDPSAHYLRGVPWSQNPDKSRVSSKRTPPPATPCDEPFISRHVSFKCPRNIQMSQTWASTCSPHRHRPVALRIPVRESATRAHASAYCLSSSAQCLPADWQVTR
jgi:hypothetical protein